MRASELPMLGGRLLACLGRVARGAGGPPSVGAAQHAAGRHSHPVFRGRHTSDAWSLTTPVPAAGAAVASPAALGRWGFAPSSALGLAAAVTGVSYLCGGAEPGAMATTLSAAALLNGALLAHEAGHLAAARALGVAVREFSIGLGPRVAWWQGPVTTYALRALPLFGYVSFVTAAQLARGAAATAAASVSHGVSHAASAAVGFKPLVLLEQLPPGRRAAVVASGVLANIVFAAALVAWQVAQYGELGVVVRPGARVRQADGWDGPGDGGAAATAAARTSSSASSSGLQQEPQRLHAGDVILRVGDVRLPAGGADMDAALVGALERAAAAAAAARGCSERDADPAAALAGVRMAVLRPSPHNHPQHQPQQQPQQHTQSQQPRSSGSGSGGACAAEAAAVAAAGGWQLLQFDALDVLRYDTLAVGHNTAAGYRPPTDAWQAAAMVGRELASWCRAIADSWTEALGGGAATATATSATTTTFVVATAGGGGGGGAGSDAHVVGPLGLVASAAAAAVAADREGRAAAAAAAAAATGAGAGGDQPYGSVEEALYGSSVVLRRPPPLLDLGIQLNLQLAAVNLLPLPVLDGGQLLLLALEALRRGRRMPPALERAALLASGAAVAAWAAALSLRDILHLLDAAGARFAAALSPAAVHAHGSPLTQEHHGYPHAQQQLQLHQQHQQQPPTAAHGGGAPAAARVHVSVQFGASAPGAALSEPAAAAAAAR